MLHSARTFLSNFNRAHIPCLPVNYVNFVSPITVISRKLMSRHNFQLTSSTPRDGEEIPERDQLFSKIVVTVKGHETMVLESYEQFIKLVCENFELDLNCTTRNRPTFNRLSLNKSPFIYKKHQRQYEFRTHCKYFTINRITGCTADVFLEYIQRNLPEGVAMEVAKHRLEKLPEPLDQTG